MESHWCVMAKPLSIREYYGSITIEQRQLITPEMSQNAATLIGRVNRFLSVFGEYRRILAGWIPEPVNHAWPHAPVACKNATMEAVDLHDPEGDLDQFVMDNQKLLQTCSLWAEHPATTRGWCHLQSVPPKSGRRIFYP